MSLKDDVYVLVKFSNYSNFISFDREPMSNQSVISNYSNILESLIRDGFAKESYDGLMIAKLPQYLSVKEEELGKMFGKYAYHAIDISFKSSAVNLILGGQI